MFDELDKKYKIAYVTFQNNLGVNVFEKIKNWYKNFFGIIKIESAGSNKIFKLPININKISQKNVDKILKNLYLQFEKHQIDCFVAAKEVKTIFDAQTTLHIPMINGKFLMKNLIMQVIDKIVEMQEFNLSLSKVYILMDVYNKENLDILEHMACNVKNINIITNNLYNFKKFETKLLENSGVAISVANNKKKSLKKAELIINFDFSAELLNKYNFNRNAIIINCSENNLELFKGFSGIVINGLKYKENRELLKYFEEYNIVQEFDLSDLYESLILKLNYGKIQKLQNKNKIIISDFVGKNGIINKEEMLHIKKLNKTT